MNQVVLLRAIRTGTRFVWSAFPFISVYIDHKRINFPVARSFGLLYVSTDTHTHIYTQPHVEWSERVPWQWFRVVASSRITLAFIIFLRRVMELDEP